MTERAVDPKVEQAHGAGKLFAWQGWRAVADLEATRSWYAGAAEWDCGCGHCRNYLTLARDRRLPPGMLEILDSLSIPPERVTDLSELCGRGGLVLYDVRFRVAGRLLERPAQGGPDPELGLWCQDNPGGFYPWGAPDFPAPCFDLCFGPWLPWVLDEPMDGPEAEREGGPVGPTRDGR